jgi:uncharacterized NAD(P)/FAD-binding protein YdhS
MESVEMVCIRVWIPSVFRHSKAVNDFINVMLKEFNGLTVYDCLGYWQDSEKQIETETVKVYEFLTQNESLEDTKAIIETECKKLKLLLSQNSVLYAIDGRPYFV